MSDSSYKNTLHELLQGAYPHYEGGLMEKIYLSLEQLRLRSRSKYSLMLTRLLHKMGTVDDDTAIILAPILASEGLSPLIEDLHKDTAVFASAFVDAVRFMKGFYKTLH